MASAPAAIPGCPQYARGRDRAGSNPSAASTSSLTPTWPATDRPSRSTTVSFLAADLWPEAAGRKDHVYLDLWESYLERA